MDEIVKKLFEIIESKDAEIKRLTDIILQSQGLLEKDRTVSIESGVDRIPLKRGGTWSDLKRKLEAEHRQEPEKTDWAAEVEKQELIDLPVEGLKQDAV